jgi:hypothetical protein
VVEQGSFEQKAGRHKNCDFEAKKKEEKETEIKLVLAFVFVGAATLGIKAFY